MRPLKNGSVKEEGVSVQRFELRSKSHISESRYGAPEFRSGPPVQRSACSPYSGPDGGPLHGFCGAWADRQPLCPVPGQRSSAGCGWSESTRASTVRDDEGGRILSEDRYGRRGGSGVTAWVPTRGFELRSKAHISESRYGATRI